MTREIKFRGILKGSKEFVYGWLVDTCYGISIVTEPLHHVDSSEWNVESFEIIPETVGQFTGLKDYKGKEIYEGDVVMAIANNGDVANMVMIFEVGEFRMVLCDKYKTYETGMGYYPIGSFSKEVIGNIYQNHELL